MRSIYHGVPLLETEAQFQGLINLHFSRASMSWRAITRKDLCVYCQRRIRPSRFTLEHILPVSAGGANRWENRAAACCSCNVQRGSHFLLKWLIDPPKRVLNDWKQMGSPFGRIK